MVILSKPLKDEFFPGFILRLCHLNSVSSPREMLAGLSKYFGVSLENRNSEFKIASLASGLSEAAVLWEHFHFPINYQFHLGSGIINYTLDKRRPPGLMPPRWFKYRLCPECLAQQQLEHHLHFWDRLHQIPSLFWCPRHNTALRKCTVQPSASHIPRIEHSEELITSRAIERAYKFSKIQYFTEILAYAYKIPYGAPAFRSQSLIEAIYKTYNASGYSGREELINLASRNFPKWWLEIICQTIPRSPGEGAPLIDRLFQSTDWRYYEYALAIAVLLEPEEWAGYKVREDAAVSIDSMEKANHLVWESIS